MVEKSSKYMKNKCSHWALRLILIGKDAISNDFSCLFRSEIAKITKDKGSHCEMDLDYCFRWLSTAPSHRIIALWVHPLKHTSLSVPLDLCHMVLKTADAFSER